MQLLFLFQLTFVIRGFIKQCMLIILGRRKNMVKVTLDLSKLEIDMFVHCIQIALDTRYVEGRNQKTAKKLMNQLSKYL